MNAKLSLQMTLLGLGVMIFYAGLLLSGLASLEILPHYTISALIFLCSGRLLRQMAANLPVRDLEAPAPERMVPDWPMRTAMLNWVAAGVLVTLMAAFLAKPPGMSFIEMLQFAAQVEQLPTPPLPMP